ncbi:Helicase required for RNAi-mediated heterochromatin assembly 1 [Pleurostoma richardsiae]|uniref:Helicase required for RNAi-mediated heterochromatin assembly 1 n=1 Tax=Pleurostoma richardsiae TaxID=41990 RepID=A0AA38VGQ4_9PEZI|nr:Helicase required for RNAi-mediated heterochromatin assembly 1 [Pleurostoma richardsiae]
MPELPSASELLARHAIEPPLNNISEPWRDKETYLAVQYQILRAEGVEGLRYSVDCFRRNPGMMDDQETCTYVKVRIRGYLMTRLGPACRISFSTERAGRKIMWQYSKRLTPGTLVALTPVGDSFSSICKVGVVAQRPYHNGLDQNPPQVDIFWADIDNAVVNPGQELVMVESRNGYFEAIRHALVGLQHALNTPCPIDKYLVFLNQDDRPASFIEQNPVLDLSSLVHHPPSSVDRNSPAYNGAGELIAARRPLMKCNILGSPPELQGVTTLDQSQIAAVHRIVTKELAIVQGPPGTGKTFTSVQSLKIMLANRRPADPPVIVAAQTNHSLDQLLALCQGAGAKVMRVGRRTEHEEIKERTVYMLARRGRSATDAAFKALEKDRRRNIDDISSLAASVFPEDMLDPDRLLQAGIITKVQYNSLLGSEWGVAESPKGGSPFDKWLGNAKTPAILEKIQNSGHEVEEADDDRPEYEFDAGLDSMVEADGEDRIDGTFIPFHHKWTGTPPQGRRGLAQALEAIDNEEDLYNVDEHLRGGVYQLLQDRLLDVWEASFYPLLRDAVGRARTAKANKWRRDIGLIQEHSIDVVGCTTTGLTKYRGFLAAMEPRSLLVEEAAQTREANIASALYPTLRQLILVGDHQQLTPQCDVQVLGGEPWYLNISMFERLINRLPFTRLNRQRRMAPELRIILNGFYPDLEDHPVVLTQRPPVAGMGHRHSFFFTHSWPEETDVDNSKFNRQEAEMIVRFFGYLVKNGLKASKITILTYYHGQRKKLVRLLQRDPLVGGAPSFFNVCTVDSYQGEENEVVILSLVRSPKPGERYSVGFLDNKNRATVAVSRARRGFFVFGNKDNLLNANEYSFVLWGRVWNGFLTQGRVAPAKGLPLVCQNHGEETWFQTPEDFIENSGGCGRACEAARPCGHPCKLNCHVTEHAALPCLQACAKFLNCGHKCASTCSNLCFCPCAEFVSPQTLQEREDYGHIAVSRSFQRVRPPPTASNVGPRRGKWIGLRGKTPAGQDRNKRATGSGNASSLAMGSTDGNKRNKNAIERGSSRVDRDESGCDATRCPQPWQSFSRNPTKYDEEVDRDRPGQPLPVLDVAIRETYKQTALVNGQRTTVAAKQDVPNTGKYGFEREVLGQDSIAFSTSCAPLTQGQLSRPSDNYPSEGEECLIDI